MNRSGVFGKVLDAYRRLTTPVVRFSAERVDDARVVSGIPCGVDSQGIYTAEGKPVAQSLLIQGGRVTNGRASLDVLSSIEDKLDGEFVYGGMAGGHFGHLLLETFARLFVFEDARVPVLFTSFNRTRSVMFWKLIDAMRLPRERVVVVEKPCIVDRVYVPEPAFVVRERIDSVFVEAYERIGRRFSVSENTIDAPVYLSRSRTSRLKRYFFGEMVIDEILRRGGVSVVYLEEHSVEEQIRNWMSWSMVFGFEGTAFHHLLFAREPKRIVYFGTRPLNKNFTLIESCKQNSWRNLIVTQDPDAHPDFSRNGPYLLSREAIARICTTCGVPTSTHDISDDQMETVRTNYWAAIDEIRRSRAS